jgi:hypothetical protein
MRYITPLFAVVVALASAVHAQPTDNVQAKGMTGEAPSSHIWGRGQLVFPGKYYYRGYVQERDGFIAQPAFRLGVDFLKDADGPIRQFGALVGMRSSFHSEQTLATGNGPSSWYESDLIAGVNATLFDQLKTELIFATITSPNGAFDTIQEIDLNLRYNDAPHWDKPWAIKPYLNIKTEIDGSAAGGPTGTLMQIGANPGFNPLGRGSLPMRLSMPVEVGLSLDDYYFLRSPRGGSDDTFGYAKVGASLRFPLAFISPAYGKWAATVGADYIFLGDNLERFAGRDGDFIPRLSFHFKF